MFQFIGFDFFADADCLNSAPSSVDNITSTTLTNAIFDHFNVTKDVTITFITDKPEEWNYDTIMDADFDGDINAGNVDFLIEQVSAIKIKRRIKGTFDWITLETVPISKVEDLEFTFVDRLNAYGVEYEYAFVPILNDIEGNYIINSVYSEFNGVYIGDFNNIYRLFFEVNYSNEMRNQQIGTLQPLGRKYPVIVANGNLSYDSGTVAAMILNDDYTETRTIDKIDIVERKETLKDYLTDKKAKILKDWNGNIKLIMVSTSPTVAYKENSGMSVPQITFGWTEIGDANSQSDLYNNGVIDESN